MRKFDPKHLIALFTALMLEYKIIFVCQSPETLDRMPVIFESLFELIKPLDKHIFTQVPQIVTQDMCELIQVPGSLLAGISQELWLKHGETVYEQDTDYSIVVSLS